MLTRDFSSTGIAFGGADKMSILSDSSLGNGMGAAMSARDAAGIAQGMAFLEGELEKRDPKIREPLTSVTWQRDIVAKTGGGWVDFTSTYNVDYATTGANKSGLIAGQTDNIPLMQANVNKDIFKVFSWAQAMKIPFVDSQKLQTIGRSLDTILDKGIRLNYNKSIDELVYKGIDTVGVTGIINDPNLVTSYVDQNAAGNSRKWKDKSVDEILWDVNKAITEAWEASEYDENAIPNHILIAPEDYAYIVSTRIGTSGDENILNYLLKNNLAVNQGRDLSIYPSRWCKGAAVDGSNRMVVYVNNDDFLYFDLPVPLTRVMTQPVALQFAYITIYAAQMGQAKFLYWQPARYYDGI